MAGSDVKMLSDLVKAHKKAAVEPLRALIDEYLLIRDTPKAKGRYSGHPISMVPRPRPPGRLSPSSVYGCQRQAVFRFAGVRGTSRVIPDQQLLFEDGNWRHHKWQFLFYDMQEVLGRDRFQVVNIESWISMPDIYVAGSLDATIRIKMKSGKWRRYIVDIKGINERGFNWISATGQPKDDNIRQLLLYMKATHTRHGILLYDNKNTNLPRTFTVGFDTEHWSQVTEWIDQTVSLLEQERIPSRHIECRKGTMMYENCLFQRMCWNSDLDELKAATFAENPRWQGIDEMWAKGLMVDGVL